MGKSKSAKMLVVDYRLSVLLGVSNAVDRFRRLIINEKVAWEGTVSTATSVSVSKRQLFGGQKEQGGVEGQIDFMPGRPTQNAPSRLAALVGRTVERTPAMRGKAMMLFTGLSSTQGFFWSQNNPIVANNIWVEVERAPIDPSLPYMWVDEFSVNPSYIVLEALKNLQWAMGAASDDVDEDSFSAAAETLYNEGLGLSLVWNRQSTIEDFVKEILTHIQATLFLSPITGKWTLKLIRDDYDVGTLRSFSPTRTQLRNYQMKAWGETINEIVVSWTNPETEQTETVTLQDLANIQIQKGDIVSDPRNYYGVRNKDLAIRLAARDLRAASAPLRSFTLDVDRSAYDIVPGEVILVTYPPRRMVNMVTRVLDVDYGKNNDSKIKLTCVEDIFGLDHPAILTPTPGTEWVDPSQLPTVLDAVQTFSIPYYFASSTDLQLGPIDLVYPETLGVILGYEPDPDTYNYDLLSRALNVSGALEYRETGTKNLVERALLPADLTQSTVILPAQIIRPDRGPRIGGYVWFGTSDETMEMIQITDTNIDGDWVIKRGILDTVPRAWPAGTPMWFVNPGAKLVDDATIRADGEIARYKMLPRTSRGRLPEESAPVIEAPMVARPHLPSRPANVKVNGNAWVATNISSGTDITITWATRNRLFEDGQILSWTAAAVTGEYAQHTVVQVFNAADDSLVYEHAGLYTETELVLPKSYFARYSSVKIKVIARKGDLDSLQGHTLTVTGLANNPVAPLPPAPPAVGPPPSMTEAPDAADFAFLPGPLINTAGISIPAITIAGTPADGATKLLIRYRVNTMPIDWIYHGAVHLSPDEPVRVDITAVKPDTVYVAEIAYGADGEFDSNFVSLGTASTGQLVASDVTHIGGRPVGTVVAEIATSLDQSLRNNLSLQSYMLVNDALQYTGDGRSVQTVALTALNETEELIESVNLLGAKNSTGTAFILNASSAQVVVDGTPTSVATAINSVVSTLDGQTAEVNEIKTAFEGLEAKYTLSVTAGGAIAGIQLFAGGGISAFTVVANQFKFVDPSDPLNIKTPFFYSGGQLRLNSDVVISGNLVVDGSITTNKIQVNGVSDYVITEVGVIYDLSTEKTVAEATINPGGGRVRATFRLMVENNNTDTSVRVKLFRNGTNISGSIGQKLMQAYTTTYVDFIYDIPGTFSATTYTLKAQTIQGQNVGDTGGTGVNRNMQRATLSLEVMKR